MTTDKLSVQALAEICYQQGIRNVIFSPGSRNAPLVIAFSEHGGFNTLVIADERVAAFHALGQAIATQVASVICCTSGTAALNYGPAIAEAYYQQVPMLILTADRPVEWIDMGIGQSMRQQAVFANYIKKSFQFTQEASHSDDLWYNERIANAAINETKTGIPGPVHINLPFRESLYNQIEVQSTRHPVVHVSSPEERVTVETKSEIERIWKTSSKRLIIVGQSTPSPQLSDLIDKLITRGEVVVMTETTSNINVQGTINCIDRVLPLVGEADNYKPDLVISIGGAIVSKRIKSYLTKAQPKQHWVIGHAEAQDTYQRLSHHFKIQPLTLLELLVGMKETVTSQYCEDWKAVNTQASVLHDTYLHKLVYCDLKVFEIILNHLPKSAILHFANSTPIRYSQLFSELQLGHKVYCNRGVSGIDGSTSTALGYSGSTDKLNILIIGDISFFYDSNAFWYNQRPTNLKIILINNGGGNIFRYIPGPETTQQLAVFESEHQLNAEPIAKLYDIEYNQVSSLNDLTAIIQSFYGQKDDRLSILEVDTRNCNNAGNLREYFHHLAKEK